MYEKKITQMKKMTKYFKLKKDRPKLENQNEKNNQNQRRINIFAKNKDTDKKEEKTQAQIE